MKINEINFTPGGGAYSAAQSYPLPLLKHVAFAKRVTAEGLDVLSREKAVRFLEVVRDREVARIPFHAKKQGLRISSMLPF